MQRIILVLITLLSLSAKATQCLDLLNVKSTEANLLMNLQKDTTGKALKILDSLLKHQMIDEHYYSHAKSDLEATREMIELKKNIPIFKTLFDKWALFMNNCSKQFENFERLSEEDQKLWKEKLELVGKFSVSQFVTFIESKGRNTITEAVYQKQDQMLRVLSELPENIVFKAFVLELEKQIKRFLSIAEILKCKF